MANGFRFSLIDYQFAIFDCITQRHRPAHPPHNDGVFAMLQRRRRQQQFGRDAVIPASVVQALLSEIFAIQWGSGNRDVVEIRRWKNDDSEGKPLWVA